MNNFGAFLAAAMIWLAPSCAGRLSHSPPELQEGVALLVDCQGTGPESATVEAIKDNWVKLKIEYNAGSKTESKQLGAMVEVWANFDRISSYRILPSRRKE